MGTCGETLGSSPTESEASLPGLEPSVVVAEIAVIGSMSELREGMVDRSVPSEAGWSNANDIPSLLSIEFKSSLAPSPPGLRLRSLEGLKGSSLFDSFNGGVLGVHRPDIEAAEETDPER